MRLSVLFEPLNRLPGDVTRAMIGKNKILTTDMSETRCGGIETGNDVRVFVCSGTSTLHPWQSDPSIKPFSPVHLSPSRTGASRVTRSSSRKALEPRSDRVGTRPVGSESRLVHHDSFGPRVWALVREDCGLLRTTMLACRRRDTHRAHAKRETPSRRIGSILADPSSVRFLVPCNVSRRRFEAAGLASSGCATQSLYIVRPGPDIFSFLLFMI